MPVYVLAPSKLNCCFMHLITYVILYLIKLLDYYMCNWIIRT